MYQSGQLGKSMAGIKTLKTVTLAGAVYFCGGLILGSPADPVGTIVFACATISSIAGFAFSAISGSMLLHFVHDPVEAVQIMLVASIALQTYSVWALRRSIRPRELLPYFAGGAVTVAPGVYLLLTTSTAMYLLALGVFLTTYGFYVLLGSPLRLQSNALAGRVLVGALGGLTGATAAFPGAFVTIWCAAHGWDKQHQRAIYQPFILGMQIVTLTLLALSAPTVGIRPGLLLYVIPAILGAHLGLFSSACSAQRSSTESSARSWCSPAQQCPSRYFERWELEGRTAFRKKRTATGQEVHMHKTLRCLLGAAGLGLLLAGTAVVAQDMVRVRGTIERVEGGAYIVKARDGSSLKLALAPNAGVAASVKSALSDITPGAFIGVAALPQADGTLRALEVHILPGSVTELAPGAAIFVPAASRQADGTLMAQRVMVGRDIAPPQ